MTCNALIVGINQYQNLKSLELPAIDATAIANALRKDNNFKIPIYIPERIDENNQLIIDPTPKSPVTIDTLEEALVNFFMPNGNAVPPTTALFYFAGHGFLKTSGGIYEGYLCAHDSYPKKRVYGLSLKWLRELLEKSTIPEKVVWLDCCHSGALLNFDDAKPNTGNYCFIAASRDYEVAYDEIEGNHGVLTNALLRGLDCANKSEITTDDLIAFVKKTLKGVTQEPVTHSSGSGIVLIRNPQYKEIPSPAPVATPAYEKGGILINAAFFTKQIYPYNSNAELKQAYYGGTKAVQWVGIVQQLDAPRQDYPAAKQAIIQSFDSENAVAALIKGDGGSGKSVLLRRLAHDLSANYRVYWLEDIEVFLEGEWQYEINKQPADNSSQTVIFLEDWYQHIENSSLEKEAVELLNKVNKKNAVRLVIGDRFAKGNHKKAYAAYISKQNIFELSANENLRLLETIFTQMPEWQEKATAEQIEKSANASLFQLLFIFQYAEDMTGSITDIYQRIFDSDCRALLERSSSPEFWQGMAKAVYFYAHLYTNEGVIVSLDFLRDLAAYLADCDIPNRCTIEMLANDKLLKKYFGLDIKHSKRDGKILNFRFHHDTMADKGWMSVNSDLVTERYDAVLLQTVIRFFQEKYSWILAKIYCNRPSKETARTYLSINHPERNPAVFVTCLNKIRNENLSKQKAKKFLETDNPWEIPYLFKYCMSFLNSDNSYGDFIQEKAQKFLETTITRENSWIFLFCLSLLKINNKNEDFIQEKIISLLEISDDLENIEIFSSCRYFLTKDIVIAKKFLKTKKPWVIPEAFSPCLTLLKDEEIAKDVARAFLKTDKPWVIPEAFSPCLTLLKDEPEGVEKAVFILENRDKFTAPHEWSLLYRSLEALCDKPMYQSLVTAIANEIISNQNTMGYQYTQLLKFPLFYVPQWLKETEKCIRNWQQPNFKNSDRPWINRNAINSITFSYKKKPELLKNMCLGIVRNWQFELQIQQPHQAYFVRCLAHPAIKQNPKLRNEVIAICQTILYNNNQLPLMIKDGTLIWLKKIAENNQFPEWDFDDDF